jgi:hypothetical protein
MKLSEKIKQFIEEGRITVLHTNILEQWFIECQQLEKEYDDLKQQLDRETNGVPKTYYTIKEG